MINFPASPKLSPLSISLAASVASSFVCAIITPFPPHSPSAFMTIGSVKLSIKSVASFKSSVWIYEAVGMLYFFRKFFI